VVEEIPVLIGVDHGRGAAAGTGVSGCIVAEGDMDSIVFRDQLQPRLKPQLQLSHAYVNWLLPIYGAVRFGYST
jgi:hypothetical protein